MLGYVCLRIDALTFHVPGVFETKCKAAPALAEDITLDDPFAEVTAPAEAGNIVKGDKVSPQPTDLQDVFNLFVTICMYRSFLSGYRIRFLIGFKEKSSGTIFLSLLWTTFGHF